MANDSNTNYAFISNGVFYTYVYNNRGTYTSVNTVSFSDENIDANLTLNTSSLTIQNSSVSFTLSAPTEAQIASGNYFLNANGQYAQVAVTSSNTGNNIPNIKNIVNYVNTTPSIIDSFSSNGVTTVEYVMSAKDNINSNFKSSKILITSDGISTYYTEFAVVQNSNTANICSFSSDLVSNNIQLTAIGGSLNVFISMQRITLGSLTTNT